MPRIDLIGASGVGKTRLYRLLCRRRRPSQRGGAWLGEGETRISMARKLADEAGLVRGLTYRAATLAPPLGRRLADYFTRGLRTEALLDVADRWEPFLRFCIQTLADAHGDPARQLVGARAFTGVVENVAFDHVHAADRLVVWGESLSHKAHCVVRWSPHWQQLAERYFQRMPLPAGVIHLTADVDEVIGRVRSRRQGGAVANAHLARNADELRHCTVAASRIADCGARVLAERGAAVVQIDARQPLASQASQAEALIASVVEAGQPAGRPLEAADA